MKFIRREAPLKWDHIDYTVKEFSGQSQCCSMMSPEAVRGHKRYDVCFLKEQIDGI